MKKLEGAICDLQTFKIFKVAICDLKHAFSILSIQVFKSKPIKRSFNKRFIYTHQLRSVLF